MLIWLLAKLLPWLLIGLLTGVPLGGGLVSVTKPCDGVTEPAVVMEVPTAGGGATGEPVEAGG
jgi:hypothetical protein